MRHEELRVPAAVWTTERAVRVHTQGGGRAGALDDVIRKGIAAAPAIGRQLSDRNGQVPWIESVILGEPSLSMLAAG